MLATHADLDRRLNEGEQGAQTAACTASETTSEAPQAQPPAPAPHEPAGNLKEIQQQRSGDYVVALLNETGDLKQGPNNLTLEFRRANDNQLADAGCPGCPLYNSPSYRKICGIE